MTKFANFFKQGSNIPFIENFTTDQVLRNAKLLLGKKNAFKLTSSNFKLKYGTEINELRSLLTNVQNASNNAGLIKSIRELHTSTHEHIKKLGLHFDKSNPYVKTLFDVEKRLHLLALSDYGRVEGTLFQIASSQGFQAFIKFHSKQDISNVIYQLANLKNILPERQGENIKEMVDGVMLSPPGAYQEKKDGTVSIFDSMEKGIEKVIECAQTSLNNPLTKEQLNPVFNACRIIKTSQQFSAETKDVAENFLNQYPQEQSTPDSSYRH